MFLNGDRRNMYCDTCYYFLPFMRVCFLFHRLFLDFLGRQPYATNRDDGGDIIYFVGSRLIRSTEYFESIIYEVLRIMSFFEIVFKQPTFLQPTSIYYSPHALQSTAA